MILWTRSLTFAQFIQQNNPIVFCRANKSTTNKTTEPRIYTARKAHKYNQYCYKDTVEICQPAVTIKKRVSPNLNNSRRILELIPFSHRILKPRHGSTISMWLWTTVGYATVPLLYRGFKSQHENDMNCSGTTDKGGKAKQAYKVHHEARIEQRLGKAVTSTLQTQNRASNLATQLCPLKTFRSVGSLYFRVG